MPIETVVKSIKPIDDLALEKIKFLFGKNDVKFHTQLSVKDIVQSIKSLKEHKYYNKKI
ncbi:MAG: hypothetical protein HRK26_00235 [Rickettsiaceae bacterium H1]|nr:hypothetical protein [Rickettsiaceae bacterium H1]